MVNNSYACKHDSLLTSSSYFNYYSLLIIYFTFKLRAAAYSPLQVSCTQNHSAGSLCFSHARKCHNLAATPFWSLLRFLGAFQVANLTYFQIVKSQ